MNLLKLLGYLGAFLWSPAVLAGPLTGLRALDLAVGSGPTYGGVAGAAAGFMLGNHELYGYGGLIGTGFGYRFNMGFSGSENSGWGVNGQARAPLLLLYGTLGYGTDVADPDVLGKWGRFGALGSEFCLMGERRGGCLHGDIGRRKDDLPEEAWDWSFGMSWKFYRGV